MKWICWCFLFAAVSFSSFAQINTSLIIGLELYQRYTNPEDFGPTDNGRSSGAVIPGVPIGLELSYGRGNHGVAVEGGFNLAPWAIDIDHPKGWGALSFPMLFKYNFGALSPTSKTKLWGYALGGGVQYSRTELFGLNSKFRNLDRKFFSSYIAQLDLGGGIGGFSAYLYLRLGIGDGKSFTTNIGLNSKVSLFKAKSKKTNSQPLQS